MTDVISQCKNILLERREDLLKQIDNIDNALEALVKLNGKPTIFGLPSSSEEVVETNPLADPTQPEVQSEVVGMVVESNHRRNIRLIKEKFDGKKSFTITQARTLIKPFYKKEGKNEASYVNVALKCGPFEKLDRGVYRVQKH